MARVVPSNTDREGAGAATLDDGIAFWRRHLDGAPDALEIATDHPRPPTKSSTGARVPVTFTAEISKKIDGLARECSVAPFAVVLAAYSAVLSRWSRQEHVVVGSPVAGRTHKPLEPIHGSFVDWLPLHVSLEGAPSFRALVERVKQTSLDAFAHRAIPFERVVEALNPPRDASRTPIFQTAFVFGSADDLRSDAARSSLSDVETSATQPPLRVSELDLSLTLSPSSEGYRGYVRYDMALFDDATAVRFADHFGRLVERALGEPDLPVTRIGLNSSAEERLLLSDWNRTSVSYPRANSVPQLVEQQVEKTPDAVALQFADSLISYRELNARSNQLARALRRRGVGRGGLVGIYVRRSPDLLVCALAVLKAGAAYVPLDPSYPATRLAYMVEDSRMTLILTQEALVPELPSQTVAHLSVNAKSSAISEQSTANVDEAGVSEDDLAYVIYTSGSTGKPKGVAVEHRSVVNFLRSMAERPGLTASDVLLAVTSLSFDIAGLELYLPLISGARIVLADEETAADGRRLLALMQATRATFLQATPATWNLLLDAGWDGGGLKALCGGEALPPTLGRALHARASSVWNMYGPTETTVWSTLSPVDGSGDVSLGRPIANTTVYILDASQQLAPMGVPGELCIGGAGLARGYLHRPELTAERFIPDPFSDAPGARLYRTGDLARFRPDGTLQYLGRLDHQVKVRGFRIELGEIESTLGAHASVVKAAVIVREDVPGDKRIVAYVVLRAGAGEDTSPLRAFVGEKLPQYMVPNNFVVLPELPLTPNGKIDRKALPAPSVSDAHQHVAPRTPIEETIAGIFGDVLGMKEVSVDESFFALGGHSLTAIRATARLREAFGVDLSVRAFFEASTVEGLAERIGAGEGAGAAETESKIERVDRSKPIPASFGQARFWFVAMLQPNVATFNVPMTMRLRGALDVDVLQKSLDALVARHEVLRTTFVSEGELPHQVIHPSMALPLERKSVEGATLGEREAAATLLVEEHNHRPFDLSTGPLLRAMLVRVGEGDHILSTVHHHITVDGWSQVLFLRELGALYGAFKEGGPSPLAPLAVDYADFAVWQRNRIEGMSLDEDIAFWRAHLDGAPDALEMPTDRARPSTKGSAGRSAPVVFTSEVSKQIDALARECKATPFMVFLAAYSAVLSRWSRQEHVVVGSPAAGRSHKEIEAIHGLFINSLALHVSLEGAPSFRALVERVKQVSLDAFAHQEIPFERVVEALNPPRDASRTPIFQTLFVYHNYENERVDDVLMRLPDVDVSSMDSPLHVSEFDLSFWLSPTPDGYRGTLVYDTALFDGETIGRFTDHLRRLLEGALRQPDEPVNRLDIVSAEERGRLLGEWNGAPAPADSPLPHQVFEAQAKKTPDAIAVRFGDAELTYGQLEAQANQLAHELVARGVRHDDVVAISLQRSLVLPVAVLAVLKAGGGYLPLDPKYPRERRQFMVEDAKPKVLLTQRSIPADSVDPSIVFLLDEDSENRKSLERHPKTPPAFSGSGEGLFYLIYTSGSTGKPKGVAMHHRPLANLLAFQLRESRCAAGDKTLQFTPLSFDVHFQELFGTWGSGGALILLTEEQRLDPGELLRIIETEGVRRIFMPYVALSSLADTAVSDNAMPRTLREVVTAGEQLVITPAIRKMFDALDGAKLFNHYGPSETHVVTSYAMQPPTDSWPRLPAIGRAVDGVAVYILDAARQLVPPGLTGEVYLGGLSPARGYFEREDLTRERFVDDPFVPGGRMYKTGDLARHLPSGDIEYLGRADGQVKVRGYRIEVGEVESALLAHPRLKEAVVVVRQDSQGGKLLVAYVVTDDGSPIGTPDLKAHLLTTLPEYMVPSAFVVLEKLPLTPSGKLDRRALPEVDLGAGAADFVAPRTEVEEAIAGIFQSVLGLPKVGVHDDFFALGGHSLKAARVVAQIRSVLSVDVPVRALFEGPTVELLARYVAQGGGESGPTPPPITRAPVESGEVMSFVQESILCWEKRREPSTTWSFFQELGLRGDVDVPRLAAAIRRTLEQQEALRVTFYRDVDGFAPTLLGAGDMPVDIIDARGQSDEVLNERLRADAKQAFLVRGEPLMRFRIYERGNGFVILAIVWHHIIQDPTESALLTKEIFRHYTELAQAEPAAEAAPLRYVDYAQWERDWFAGDGAQLVEAARARIANLEVPQIADHPEGSVYDTRTIEEHFVLDAEATKKFLDAFRAESVTTFMALTALFGAILARKAGSEHAGMIAPVSLRSGLDANIKSVLGRFLGWMPLHVSLRGCSTWRQLLTKTRSGILDASAFQSVPISRVLGTDDAFDHPFGRVAVNVVDGGPPQGVKVGGLEVAPYVRPTYANEDGARNDLALFVVPAPNRFFCLIRGAASRFEPSTIRALADQMKAQLLSFDPGAAIPTTFG